MTQGIAYILQAFSYVAKSEEIEEVIVGEHKDGLYTLAVAVGKEV